MHTLRAAAWRRRDSRVVTIGFHRTNSNELRGPWQSARTMERPKSPDLVVEIVEVAGASTAWRRLWDEWLLMEEKKDPNSGQSRGPETPRSELDDVDQV